MKLILCSLTLLFLWSCKPEKKKVDTPKTDSIKSTKKENLKIEYNYINFVNNRLVVEKYNIYDTDTARVRKSGYKFKTIKQSILYNNSWLKKSAIKRSNFKLLVILNHLDSAYLTTDICPIKYYDDFYILVNEPNKDSIPPFGNQLYYFDTLNVCLTKLKYNQTLKEPVKYNPGKVIMYEYSNLENYDFFISKTKMEFKLGKSLNKIH